MIEEAYSPSPASHHPHPYIVFYHRNPPQREDSVHDDTSAQDTLHASVRIGDHGAWPPPSDDPLDGLSVHRMIEAAYAQRLAFHHQPFCEETHPPRLAFHHQQSDTRDIHSPPPREDSAHGASQTLGILQLPRSEGGVDFVSEDDESMDPCEWQLLYRAVSSASESAWESEEYSHSDDPFPFAYSSHE